MRRIFLFCVASLSFLISYSQDDGDVFNKPDYFKVYAYLEISKDQLNAGLLTDFSELRSNNTFKDSLQLVRIQYAGLPEEIIPFKVLIQYPKELKPFEYIFCYDAETGVLFKLKGFYNNDYTLFFDDLKSRKLKINSGYFNQKGISIEGINLNCLIDLYRTKKFKDLTDNDRQEFDCLKYNLQPVIVH